MSSALPQSDVSRFTRIEPEFIVKAYVSCATQGVSATQLKRRLSGLLTGEAIKEVIGRLVSSGELVDDRKKLHLAPATDKSVRAALGSDAGKSWNTVQHQRLPALALGADPDKTEMRNKLARAEVLRAAIVCIGYDLPKEQLLSPTAVRSELIWRILRAVVPDIVGSGPFPSIDKPNALDRMILAGLAGVRAKTISVAFAALAAKVINAGATGSADLHRQLIRIALGNRPATDSFPARVNLIARKLTTPPFQGRVAIAQVYDAYGREFSDAGSLDSFKQRLVAAGKTRELHLSRLDLPEHMNRDLRTRSATPAGSDEVHFIVTEWK
jgi:hypothetical protein